MNPDPKCTVKHWTEKLGVPKPLEGRVELMKMMEGRESDD